MRTASATDVRNVSAYLSLSGGCSFADSNSRSSSGRIKLPTNVVRMRSLLRFTGPRCFPGGDPFGALQETGWPHHGAPHVGHRAVVEAQTFCGLAEVAAQDVDEVFQMDLDIRIERVEVVDGDEPAGHIPLVFERGLVVGLDVRLGL